MYFPSADEACQADFCRESTAGTNIDVRSKGNTALNVNLLRLFICECKINFDGKNHKQNSPHTVVIYTNT